MEEQTGNYEERPVSRGVRVFPRVRCPRRQVWARDSVGAPVQVPAKENMESCQQCVNILKVYLLICDDDV